MTHTPHEETILKLGRNPELAHRVLFGHRHPDATPEFHREIVQLWHSTTPRVLFMAFRGGAKSTISEETIIVQACLRKFNNCIILGESYERAVERLRAVKHEFEQNPYIEELFGRLVGGTWTEGKIILANGVIIQAFGRGQSLRGSKHLDKRPDLAFGDDIEDEESVTTPEAREKTLHWFTAVLMPALDPKARMRVAATPLDPEALSMKLLANEHWVSRVYPIEHKDADGERVATWPARFPLDEIDRIKAQFTSLGAAQKFAQEYMCEASDPSVKAFTSDMMRVEMTQRTWQPVYAFYDPARTVKARSAQTGVAIWSYVGSKIVVWDAYGKLWKPDEIINDIFLTDTRYSPVAIGVEEDGLNEFILQPLRQHQVARGQAIPLRAMRAPKGKIDFIKGLQPFFKAGEVVFAQPLPQLVEQLLAFPTGLIDVANALAYALRMKPGQPLYDGFAERNIVPQLELAPKAPVWLAVNARAQFTTAALVQFVEGAVHVVADWVREGDPGLVLADIVAAAGLEARRSFRVVAGPAHFGTYETLGLRGAARKVHLDVARGAAEHTGREEIRSLLSRTVKGLPAVKVSDQATWTLRGLSGGYARAVQKDGTLTDEAIEGPYRVLIEGLESFAGLLRVFSQEGDTTPKYAVTSDGRRYLSARA